MGWNDALTKPGLLYGDGSASFYPNDAARVQDFIQKTLASVQPLQASIPSTIPDAPAPSSGPTSAAPYSGPLADPAQALTPGGGTEGGVTPNPPAAAAQPPTTFTAPSTTPLPKFFRPTVQQAVSQTPTDNQGRPVGFSPGLSKLGVLMNVLHGAVQGGSDALASGALNAAPGKSGFGAGWEGATMMPIQRAMMGRQLAVQQQEMALKAAQANEANANAHKAGIITLARPGAQAVDANGNVIASSPLPAQKLTPEQELMNYYTSDLKMTPAAAYGQIQQAKSENKPDTSEQTKQGFRAIIAKVAGAEGMPTAALTDARVMAQAINKSQALSPAEKQQAMGYLATNTTPAAQGTQTIVRLEGMENAMMNRNMQTAVDQRQGSPTYGQEIFVTPGMMQQFGTGAFTPTRDNPQWQAGVSAARSGVPKNVGDNIVSYNQLLGHVGDLNGAISSLRNTQSPLINKPWNWLSNHAAGNPDITNFMTAMAPVRQEFYNFLLNNKALKEEDRAAAQATLNENMSPAQMDGALRQITKTGAIRLGAVNAGIRRTTKADIPDLVEPNAQNVLNMYGVKIPDYGAAPQKPGQQPAAPQPNKHSDLGFIPLGQ